MRDINRFFMNALLHGGLRLAKTPENLRAENL